MAQMICGKCGAKMERLADGGRRCNICKTEYSSAEVKNMWLAAARERIAPVQGRLAADYGHTVGIKADGTVIATEYIVGAAQEKVYPYKGQCDVSGWSDIAAVAAGSSHTVGLKVDGTAVAVGDNGSGQCNVADWSDIIAVSAGQEHSVGLRANGTLVATPHYHGEYKYGGQCEVCGWDNIVAVSAGVDYTVALKEDGAVLVTNFIGDKIFYFGQTDVDGWNLSTP